MSTDAASTSGEVSQDEFFSAMGDIAEPVYVITTFDSDDNPIGFTATSVTSLSGDPPSLIICVNRDNDGAADYFEGQSIAAHVLASHQEAVGNRFAGVGGISGSEKFDGDFDWHEDDQVPVIDDTHVVMQGEIDRIYDGYTHKIAVMTVKHVTNHQREPLLYWSGEYVSLRD